MANSTGFYCVDKADDSGWFFGQNRTGNPGARRSARGETANCLYDRQLATGANCLPYSATLIARHIPDIAVRHTHACPNSVEISALRPAKPDHRAASLHDCISFGYEHAGFSIRHDGVPQRNIQQTPAETSVLHSESFAALNAPTKALKNARIRRPFSGNASLFAADASAVESSIHRPLQYHV